MFKTLQYTQALTTIHFQNTNIYTRDGGVGSRRHVEVIGSFFLCCINVEHFTVAYRMEVSKRREYKSFYSDRPRSCLFLTFLHAILWKVSNSVPTEFIPHNKHQVSYNIIEPIIVLVENDYPQQTHSQKATVCNAEPVCMEGRVKAVCTLLKTSQYNSAIRRH